MGKGENTNMSYSTIFWKKQEMKKIPGITTSVKIFPIKAIAKIKVVSVTSDVKIAKQSCKEHEKSKKLVITKK